VRRERALIPASVLVSASAAASISARLLMGAD
jgi:hypothetical protein